MNHENVSLIERLRPAGGKAVITPIDEFKIGRAGAAAGASLGGSVESFLGMLGVSPQVPAALIRRIETALVEYAAVWREREEITRRWERVVWDNGDAALTDLELVELERERRATSERCIKPVKIFRFLLDSMAIPSVRFRIPTPAEVTAKFAAEITDPSRLYRIPGGMPVVETSRKIPGPSWKEYIVRFKSPSGFFNDDAYARVYEPERAPGGAMPTLIYGSGLAMAYDQVTYWPEEEYMGRFLARRGYRVILMESPWHGRRAVPGFYGSELYFGTAPSGLFLLHAAQAQETAIMVQWARSTGASVVAVGGMSLGGVVAQQVAGYCGYWPELMRPDLIFLAATSNLLDRILIDSDLSRALEVDRAVRQAGWNEENLARVRPLLDPPTNPGISPDRIHAVLGRFDTSMPYAFAVEMLEQWRVPAANITAWKASHIGFVAHLLRKSEFQNLIMQTMDSCRSRKPGWDFGSVPAAMLPGLPTVRPCGSTPATTWSRPAAAGSS